MVNAPGTMGLGGAKSPQIVKMAGGAGNVVTLAKPGQTVAGKQTIVINKPGAQGTAIKGAQGQQIIMVCDAKIRHFFLKREKFREIDSFYFTSFGPGNSGPGFFFNLYGIVWVSYDLAFCLHNIRIDFSSLLRCLLLED